MLTLYHGTTSVCAIKVRLTLAEKGLDWDGRLINLQREEQYDPEYLKLNPNGVVPTLVHDDNVIIESSVIMLYLDEVFPEPALVPPDALARVRLRLWMKTVDEKMHPFVNALTFATANRKALIRKSPEEREAYYRKSRDPVARERKRQSVEHGLDAPLVGEAIRFYDGALTRMEADLADAPYLAGTGYSLADAAVTPYINRLDLLGLSFLWQQSRPRVAAWFDRIRTRPSFEAAITGFFTESDRERFAPDGQDMRGKVTSILDAA